VAEQWYYQPRGGKQVGPVSGTELRQLAASGQLSPTDLVWKEGMGAWVPASSIKGLFNSNPAPPLVSAAPSVGADARPDADEDDDDRDDYRRASRQGSPSGHANALAAITATEFGLSSTMLGGITLMGQLYPLLGAMAAEAASGGGMVGATLMLMVFLLLSIFAGFLGVMGILTALRKTQAGGTYSIVGICVSGLAFITSLMLLYAVASARRGHGF
jgi:hypothetical protein